MDLVILARAIHLSHACPPTRWIGGPRAGAACERTPPPNKGPRNTVCVSCGLCLPRNADRGAAGARTRDPWCVIGYMRCE